MAMLGIVPNFGNAEKELSRAILEEKLMNLRPLLLDRICALAWPKLVLQFQLMR